MNANLLPMLGSMNSQIPSQSKEIPVFVRKLYRMLESDKHAEYIRWNATGNSFIIPDGPLLAAVVLPQFFKASTFSSFVRQLNNYEFRRISDARKAKNPSSQLASVFTHPSFQRGKYNQLHLIKRSVNRATRVKSKIHCKNSDKGEEIFLPQLVSGLDCSSSESEDLGDIGDLGDLVENPAEHCTNCQNLCMEVQVLRQRLRSYEDIFAVNVEQNASAQQKSHETGLKYPQIPQQDNATVKSENWSLESSNQEFEIFSKLSWMYDMENPTLSSPQSSLTHQNYSWCVGEDNEINHPAVHWDMASRADDRKGLEAFQLTDIYPFL